MNVLGSFPGSNFKVTPIVERTAVGVRGLKVLWLLTKHTRLQIAAETLAVFNKVFDSGLGSPLLKSVQIGSGVQAASYSRVAGVCFPVIKQPGREFDHLSQLVQNLQ
jgi:hypothetical protein